MENNPANTNPAKPNRGLGSGEPAKWLKFLPWGLFVIALLLITVLIVDRFRLRDLGLSKDRICDESMAREFVELRWAFARKDNGSQEAFKNFMNGVESKAGYDNDPTCVYMQVKYLYDTRSYDAAYFKTDHLKELYDVGKITDSRFMPVDSLEQVKRDIAYFKALKIESEMSNETDQGPTDAE